MRIFYVNRIIVMGIFRALRSNVVSVSVACVEV